MKIKVLRSVGTDHAVKHGLPLYTEGQVVDVDDKSANKLIARKLAVQVPDEDEAPAKKSKKRADKQDDQPADETVNQPGPQVDPVPTV